MQDPIDRTHAITAFFSVIAMVLIGFVVHTLMWRSVSPSYNAPYLKEPAEESPLEKPKAEDSESHESEAPKGRPAKSGGSFIA